MELYERIFAARNAANLTQKQLAELMCVSLSTVAEWEAGDTVPTTEELQRLDEILKLSDVPPFRSASKAAFPLKLVLIGAICLLVLLATVLLFVFQPWSTPFSERAEDIALASDSVVKVMCYNQFGDLITTGTAFCAFDDKTFITNYHVVDDAWKVEIITHNDLIFQVAHMRNFSEEYDVAILQTKERTDLAPLMLETSGRARRGNIVTAITSPTQLPNTVSQGKISGSFTEDTLQYLQFTASVSQGSSGGALFNEKGNVIGVISAAYADERDLSLAVPIAHAIEIFENATYIKETFNDTCPYEEYLNIPLSMLAQLPSMFEEYAIRIDAYISSVDSMGYAFVTYEDNVDGAYSRDTKTWNSGGSEETELFYITGDVYIEPWEESYWGRDLYSPSIEGKPGNAITLVGIVRINNSYGYPRVYIDCYSYYVYK